MPNDDLCEQEPCKSTLAAYVAAVNAGQDAQQRLKAFCREMKLTAIVLLVSLFVFLIATFGYTLCSNLGLPIICAIWIAMMLLSSIAFLLSLFLGNKYWGDLRRAEIDCGRKRQEVWARWWQLGRIVLLVVVLILRFPTAIVRFDVPGGQGSKYLGNNSSEYDSRNTTARAKDTFDL